ncbi:MAG: adhesion molecule [Monoraphidium minutum]|nr:MAG: adhesion molecule [Monoraphidium minutum]
MLPAGSRLICEGRFGKLVRDGKTLKPDTRKGMLRVIRTEDGLLHLTWAERADAGGVGGAAEEDTILFPEEASFVQIPGQRAAALKFAAEPDRNLFFWLQEAEAVGDAALVARIHAAINAPLGTDDGGGDDEDMADGGGGAPASDALLRGALATGPAAGLAMPSGPMVGEVPQGPGQDPWLDGGNPAAQLAAMLSGIASGAPAAGGGAAGGQDAGSALGAALLAALARQQHGAAGRGAAGPSLADVLRPDVVAPLLADPEVLARLGQYLPEEHRSVGELRALARSAQFQQQLAAFSAALQSGQLDLSQFGLRAEGFSVTDFLNALEELVEREARQAGGAAGGAPAGQ